MKKIFAFLIFCTFAYAQNVRVDGTITNRLGAPVPGASIAVCSQPATINGAQCTPLVNLCVSLTDTICDPARTPNPVSSDGLGNYFFYVPLAQEPFTQVFSGSGVVTRVQPDQTPGGGGSGGGGGGGDAQLHPNSDQTFQALCPTCRFFFLAPQGASGTLKWMNFQKPDGTNILSLDASGNQINGDGMTGSYTAGRFIHGVGTPAALGVFSCANTDICLSWRNNAGSADSGLSKDNFDVLNFFGFSGLKFGTNFLPTTTPTTIGRPIVANDLIGTFYSSQFAVDASAPAFADPGGDDCLTLHTALISAAVLGQDVDARGLTGNRACITDPMLDTYNGRIFLGPSIWWLRSNAASWTISSRLDIIGAGPGRTQSGPTNGTIMQLCNESDVNAHHSVICNGTTFAPLAANLCRGGDPASGTPFNCPMSGWSKTSEHFAPTQQFFDTHIMNMTFAGNNVVNAVGVQNGLDNVSINCASGACGAQEPDSGLVNVRFEEFGAGTANMIRYETGSRNSAIQHVSLNNNNITQADCSAAIPVVVSTTVSGNGPKLLSTVTSTNTACTTRPVTAVQWDTSQGHIDGLHCEQVSGQCLDIAKNHDVQGLVTDNVNGVLPAGQVIHIETGHLVGVDLHSTLNINTNGYVIRDETHTFGGLPIKIRVPGPDGENLVASYSFDMGSAGVNPINSSSPFVPKSFDHSPNLTSNMVLGQWDLIKPVIGGDITATKALTTDTDGFLGFTRMAITDVADNVPVVSFGDITGPVADASPNGCSGVGGCCDKDLVIPSTATAGHVQCTTSRPFNIATLGRILVASTPPGAVAMTVDIQPPQQPITFCTSTGVDPLVCNQTGTFKNLILLACPHADSGTTGTGLCTINTNAAISAAATMALFTRTNQQGTGAGQCENNMTETATSIIPIKSITAGVVVLNVPTLNTANAQYCGTLLLINP